MSQAVDDSHELMLNHSNEFYSWLRDVQQAYRGWQISEAAVAFLEQEGRRLDSHQKTAVGLVATILVDIAYHMKEYRQPGDAVHRVWNNAVNVYRTDHYARATGFHPMVIANVNIAIEHLKDSSGAR